MKKVIVLVLGALALMIALALGAFFPAAGGGAVVADDGAAFVGKLPLNGDFCGLFAFASPVTGWRPEIAYRKGAAKVVPTRDPDKFMLELQAPANDWHEFVSDFIPLAGVKEGDRLQVKGEFSGTGQGGFGWEAYESSWANPLFSLGGHSITQFIGKEEAGKAQMSVPGGDGAPLPPKARFVRVRLLAGAGSTIRFADVRATINGIRDLPLNGVFRGPAAGLSPAVGWTLGLDGGGSAEVVPTAEPGKFALEVRATADKAQTVFSDCFPVKGGFLKVKVAGLDCSGNPAVGFEAFDASQARLLQSTFLGFESAVAKAFSSAEPALASKPLKAVEGKSSATMQLNDARFVFPLPVGTRFVRVCLRAPAGAVATFRGVEATMADTKD